MAKSVRSGGTTDGPFVDSGQVVAGVYILEAPDHSDGVVGTPPA